MCFSQTKNQSPPTLKENKTQHPSNSKFVARHVQSKQTERHERHEEALG
jgi:hypothetical protein